MQVYRDGLAAALRIWHLTTRLRALDRRSAEQARGAATAVPANTAEAWGKRRYPRSFAASLVIAQGEAHEMRFWLQFAGELGLIPESERAELDGVYRRLCGQLLDMSENAAKWCPPQHRKPDR